MPAQWQRSLLLCLYCGLVSAAANAAETPPHVDPSWPHAQPPYPDSAQAGSEQGAVDVAVLVRPNGHVGRFRVVQSSGFEDLDDAAVESVLNWRFVPAMRDGDTVSDWTTVRIVFRLPQQPDLAKPPPPSN